MKLNTSFAIDSSSAGFGDTKAFGFEMNAMAFHAVVDGIYSDKIEAPVREYMTNAFDAHRMIGNENKPFEIQAPSQLNPYFRVRDFGPGMTHEDVQNRATTMFASNKRDSNNQVGMLGLGMKSAFAYTNMYTITAYDGRTKRVYTCYLDEGSMPTVSSMPVEISPEPAGIEISIPVRNSDIYRFQAAIRKVAVGFDVPPVVMNEQFKLVAPVDIIAVDGWRLIDHASIKRPFVRQGCVLYPLDMQQIHEATDTWSHWNFNETPLILNMPIGTVSVSTSRESIGYDAETKRNLRAAFLNVLATAKTSVVASLDKHDDFHEACTAYGQVRGAILKLVGGCHVLARAVPAPQEVPGRWSIAVDEPGVADRSARRCAVQPSGERVRG